MEIQETFLHENLFRGEEVMEKISRIKICICGAGCLGANLAENLARCGFKNITIIDRDKVEIHNLSTQPYLVDDVGERKASVISNYIYDAVEVEVNPVIKNLEERNAKKLLRDFIPGDPLEDAESLVIDTFDNHISRKIVMETCRNQNIPCLHIGLSRDGYGEAKWNGIYRVPKDIIEEGACDYPLARNLILILIGAATEVIFAYVSKGEKKNISVTINDLKINTE